MSEVRRPGSRILKLRHSSGDPVTDPAHVQVYTKDVGGVDQIFVVDTNGTVYQVSPAGLLVQTQPPPPSPPAADYNFLGIDITLDGLYGYVGNQNGDVRGVWKFDVTTSQWIKPITCGTGPSYLKAGFTVGKVYVSNFSDGTVSVINAATDAVIATIPGFTQPGVLDILPDNSIVYVCDYLANQVVRIDTSTDSVAGSPIAVTGPISLTVNPAGTKVYVARTSGIDVISTATNTIIASIPLTSPNDIVFTPDSAFAYVRDTSNTIVRINATTDAVVGPPIALGGTCMPGIALTTAGAFWKVYVPMANGDVEVISTLTNLVIATISGVGANGFEIQRAHASGTVVFVSHFGAFGPAAVTVIDGTTDTVTGDITGVVAPPPADLGRFGAMRVFGAVVADEGGGVFSLTIPAPTSNSGSVRVFRPGSGEVGPVIFDDFNALYATLGDALASGGGQCTVYIDDRDQSPAVLDPGTDPVTYDFTGVKLVGIDPHRQVPLNIVSGSGETGTLTITGASYFENLSVQAVGNDTAFQGQENQAVTLVRTTFVGAGQYVYDFISVSGCVVHLDEESHLQRDSNAAIRVNGQTLSIHVVGDGVVIDNLGIAGFVGGNIDVTINNASARVDPQQDIASAAFSMRSASGFWNADPNGVLVASQGTLVSDETTGAIWRNVDGSTAWAAFSNSVFQWRVGVSWASIYAQMSSVPGPKMCLVEYDPATNGDRTVTNNGGVPQDFNNIFFLGLSGAPSDGTCAVLVVDDGFKFAPGPQGVRISSQDVGWNFSALTAPAYVNPGFGTWTTFNMTGGDLRGSFTAGVAVFEGTLWLLLRDVHANSGAMGKCTDGSDELWLRGGTRVFNPIFIDDGNGNGLAVFADASCQWSAAGLIANGLYVSPMEVNNYAKGTGSNLYSISVDGGGNVIATLVP